VSGDLFRVVLFQGHPEYDTISLLKEYKREVMRLRAASATITRRSSTTTSACRFRASSRSTGTGVGRWSAQAGAGAARAPGRADPAHTWHDTAEASSTTGSERSTSSQPRPAAAFMDGVDPEDPLGWRGPSEIGVFGGADRGRNAAYRLGLAAAQ